MLTAEGQQLKLNLKMQSGQILTLHKGLCLLQEYSNRSSESRKSVAHFFKWIRLWFSLMHLTNESIQSSLPASGISVIFVGCILKFFF